MNNPARDIADLAVLLAGTHDVPPGKYADDAGTTFRPARRPARRNVDQAAIRASLMGLTF